ncbi:MAG: hypothetical protein ABIQ31_18600 [Ferruginibacter sp.]
MAKLKHYPKAPKASASLAAKQNHVARCKEIDRANAQAISEDKKSKALTVQIRKIHTKGSTKGVSTVTRKKRKAAPVKKAAKGRKR